MNKRFYPVTEDFFNNKLLSVIESSYVWKGRPPRISHYKIFCAAMYVLRTGVSWRDLPKCYGHWNHVYQRVKRLSDRGVWWQVLLLLQRDKEIKLRVVMGDSSTIKFHRHGGGLKGGFKVEEGVLVE